jgi:division protein CdvB (Snf7/Vps24/ESCRT-III family)
MPNERENFYQPLTYTDYDIAGNVFRAYYDADQKLVMVLDFVINDLKPNVLLVINPVGDRKWDDILMNDYAVDLETIRPKKNNKYQKLDIEYTGLAEYDNLVRAYNDGDNLSGALADLLNFRNAAARRAALERLGAADAVAERARETIEKTNKTISAQQVRLKKLRGKLAEQRRDIGKEPTKQSAAKILRTESQIDATNNKIARAKKRLNNAQHRLDVATEDADTALKILARLDDLMDTDDNLPTTPIPTQLAEFEQPSVPMAPAPQFTEITPYEQTIVHEPKAKDMADEEVKPLFDKDPEILDEEIAFKPIDFNLPAESVVAPVAATTDKYAEPTPVVPLSFAPPVQTQPVEPSVAPVLDSLTSVDLPSEHIDSELLATIEPTPLPQEFVAPVPEPVPTATDAHPVADVLPSQSATQSVQPMPEISPAPVDSGMRPVSPITGVAAETATPVSHKPTTLYYVMLVVLIMLSIFTLWFYQKSANDTLPELGTQTKPIVEEVVADAPAPFIAQVEVAEPQPQEPVAVVEPEPILPEPEVADIEPEPIPVTPALPVQVADEVVPTVEIPATPAPVEEVVAEPDVAPVEPETPFLTDETVVATPPKPIIDIVVDKPAYNVSQNEKMFVAAPEYETDVVAQEEIETCADGAAPDADGCCTGEELVEMSDGALMCCSADECFPPML